MTTPAITSTPINTQPTVTVATVENPDNKISPFAYTLLCDSVLEWMERVGLAVEETKPSH